MALNEHDQFNEAARRGQRILVALPHAAGLDEAAAALALGAVLRGQGKTVDLVSDGFEKRPEHSLLPAPERIQKELGPLQHLLISVPLGRARLRDLGYTITGDDLLITLAPEGENWNPAEVKTRVGGYRYDLAVTLGAPDLDSLGAVYRGATDFWHSVPILNVDHAAANERYGAVNLVDIRAAAVSEVAHDLLLECDPRALDREISTALLAGIIHKTRNFKTENVSPKTLTVAAKLVEAGADRERIMNLLYRTHNVETLRLWGRALARLRVDTGRKIAWTLLSRQDFVAAGASEADLAGVLEDLVAASPEVAISFVLYEAADRSVKGILHSNRADFDAFAVARDWSPAGSPRQAAFSLPAPSIVEASELVLQKIKALI